MNYYVCKSMKKLSILGALVTAMLLGSCTNDDATTNESEILKGINVTIEQADFFAQSRATYEVDPTRGFVSSWSEGDVIGIYPIGGDQVAFPISDNAGSSTARFDGGSWALRSNYKYSAYYPFSKSNYTVSETEIPVNYTGQAQNGNNSTAGLAAYDFLAAAATQPNSSGSVDLIMKHLGAFVRFQLTMPKAATLINANVASDGAEFVTSGTVDLSAAIPAITSKTTASNFNIALTNITYTEDEVVTLYAMVAPVNLSSNNMVITLSDNANKTYIYECNGTNFAAGKSYSFTIKETNSGTGVIDHESVDLGLSVEWATCNIGANNPEECGDYFAWAETAQQSDNRYTWESYKWSDGGSATTLTKYCTSASYGIVDNKTILAPTHDAATENWGFEWRTPTKAEVDELINNCTWTWTTLNGMKGYSVISKKNSNSIFLPAAGCFATGAFKSKNELGVYWASSLHETKSNCAYNAGFNETDIRYDYLTSRYVGQSVRAIRKKAAASIPVTSIIITGSKTEIGVAETLQLSATVAPTNATNKTLKWGTSDVSIAKVSSAGLVTGVKAGIVTITAAAQDGSGVCGTYTITISNTSNGHEFVDLGLSVKWATMNVGATAPEGIGNKYAWGETKTKSSYSWDNYKWASLGTYGNHNYDLKKYNSDAEWGKTDSKSTLDSADDAATANWGGKWRMPSCTEQQELLDNCTWTSTTVNKVKGFTVKSKKNGNSIFLPSGDVTKNYWARTRHGLCDRAYCIDYLSTIQWGVTSRPNGLNVRAVCP